ncbi:hypothetical protein BDN72DRAFT_859126 [Pluteus cervinus]|uniref:Uncharacterized protein n=1 Tax=Pluteus cervinus TaxID=181527 RepID=A0ACD3AQ86_9AGAR|nr:hypothetical protein BDN72DRAFT_859126 [Pluteus cervinus]
MPTAPSLRNYRVIEIPHFYDPHASRRSQIDDQILVLNQQIQILQMERNTLLPISSIPDEIFAHIFLLCRGRDLSNGADMQALVQLTWVCHHWRSVALTTPSLWAYIGKENFPWAGECLTRSKEAPLHVVMSLGDSSIVVGSLVLSQIHRFRNLWICVDPSYGDVNIGEVVQGLLTQPAPMLESLTLNSVPLPTPLFSGISPFLEYVMLRTCWVNSWTSNMLPFFSLKFLSLELHGDVSAITFIQSLPPSLPSLETLILEGAFVASPGSFSAPLPAPVHFPNLKTLQIWNPYISPITEFLPLFNLVPSTRVNLEFNSSEDETLSESLRLLRTSQILIRPILSIRLSHNEYFNNSRFVVQALRSPDDDSPLRFSLTHGVPWSEMAQVFTSLPAERIIVLTLQILELSVNDWVDIFSQCVNLEELVVETQHTAESFIAFIIAATPKDFDDTVDLASNQSFPFQSLRNLDLSQYDFRSDVGGRFFGFYSALKVRRQYGLRLEKLCLPQTAIYLDFLRELVDEVIIQL